MSVSGKNKGIQHFENIRAENKAQMNRREVQDTVRESRQGYRGTAMFQTARYYSQEGLLVVNLGGPPVVGR